MQRHAPTVEETIKTASRLYVRRDIGRKRQAIGLFIEFLDDRANKRNNRHRLEHSYDQGQEAFEQDARDLQVAPPPRRVKDFFGWNEASGLVHSQTRGLLI